MKTIDQSYSCPLPGQLWHLHCHIRIFQPHAHAQVVMISDMGFEIGWFNPSIIETLVEQVVHDFHLDPTKLIWIEHYSPDFREPSGAEFSHVTFEWQDSKATNPQWTSIALERIQALVSKNPQLVSV